MRKATICIFIFLYITLKLNLFSQFPSHYLGPYSFSRPNKNHCEFQPKVKDEKRGNCNFNNGNNFFPVHIEEFDDKWILPNNWQFTSRYTALDNYTSEEGPSTYLGYGLEPYHNNLTVSNGLATLEWKHVTTPNSITGAGDLKFTGCFLNSLFDVREGFIEARIKLPENIYFWPAFWLYGGEPLKQEIDIFEFYDEDVTKDNCSTYHRCRITQHKKTFAAQDDKDKCSRGRKFPVDMNTNSTSDYFDSWHTYSLFWTDYQLLFWIDSKLVMFSTKYYEKPWVYASCNTQGEGIILTPKFGYSCQSFEGLPDCKISYPFGNGCAVENKVYKGEGFPSANNPMSIKITNRIRPKYISDLENNWSSLPHSIEVDYVAVWQPVNFWSNTNYCSFSSFMSQTGNTNFGSGKKITLGGTNCTFVSAAPYQGNQWNSIPIHLLASDEIALEGDVSIEENTYFRAEIVDPTYAINQTQRSSTRPDELIANAENQISLQNQNALNYQIDSLGESFAGMEFPILYPQVESLSIWPNPANTIIQIDINPEDFNDLIRIEISTILGETFFLPISLQQDLSGFAPGQYFIKFYLADGHATVKRLIIER